MNYKILNFFNNLSQEDSNLLKQNIKLISLKPGQPINDLKTLQKEYYL